MTESTDQNSEEYEAAPQEQYQSHETDTTQEEPEEKPQGATSREHFRRLEQSKKDLERRSAMQEELIERLMKQSPQSVPQPVQELDEFDEIADDDFIPKGKVRALIHKEARKIAAEVSQQEQQKFAVQQHQSTFMTRLKGQFSDFDEVVNQETLAILEESNPELAQIIVDSKDPYKMGIQSYKFIKAMNLHSQVASPRAKDVEKKLAANAKTVQSPQAFSKRPMAQAFQSSQDEMRAMREEMHHYASKAGSGL